MPSPWHTPHVQATEAEASEQAGPHAHLCQTGSAPPSSLSGRPQPLAPVPALPQRQPHGAAAAASLRADSGPTRTPHHSHCFKSSRHKAMRAGGGSETQSPAKTEKGRGRDTGAERTGDRGQGRGSKGRVPRALGGRSRLGTPETRSGETTETDVGRAGRGPHQRSGRGGGLSEDKERKPQAEVGELAGYRGPRRPTACVGAPEEGRPEARGQRWQEDPEGVRRAPGVCVQGVLKESPRDGER